MSERSKKSSSDLLGDLESLQTLLNDGSPVDYEDIPTLEVRAELQREPAEPIAPKTAAPAGDDDVDYQREFLIQEIVDEFMPSIEAALRRRLLSLDISTLMRLQQDEGE